MSIVFTTAQTTSTRLEHILLALVVISAILCGAWLIRLLVKGDALRQIPKMPDRPGLGELALAVIGMLVLSLLLSRLFEGLLGSETLAAALAASLASLLSCSAVLLVLAWRKPIRFKALGLEAVQFPRQLGWGLITALAVWPMATLVLMPASFRIIRFVVDWGWGLKYTLQPHTLLRELSESSSATSLCLTIGMAVVIAPLTEEIIFRGLMQGALVRLYRSRWIAIVMTAAIFAALHLTVREDVAAGESSLAQLETIAPLFLLGLVLGYAYEKSRSLYRPICIHLGFNALSVVMLWLNSA